MKKKEKKKPPESPIIKTDLSFEELMKKALTTPLPKKATETRGQKPE